MLNFIKWNTKRQLTIYAITLSIVVLISLALPIFFKGELIVSTPDSEYVIDGKVQTFSSAYIIDAIYGSVLGSIGIMILVVGALTLNNMRFMMQLGSSRDKALFSNTISSFIMIAISILVLFIMKMIKPSAVFIPISYTAFGYVFLFFIGFFCNALVTCLRPRYSVPTLILYFGLALKIFYNEMVKSIETGVRMNLWLFALSGLVFNIVVGYLLFKCKFSVIKSASI